MLFILLFLNHRFYFAFEAVIGIGYVFDQVYQNQQSEQWHTEKEIVSRGYWYGSPLEAEPKFLLKKKVL